MQKNEFAMLHGLIQASPLATIVLDLDGTVRLWSPAAERIHGWREEEVLGRFHPGIPDHLHKEFLANLDAISKGKVISGLERRVLKKGGFPVDISLWGVPLTDDHGNHQCLFIVADMSEKRKLEEERLKIQKLESLGLLAGGIAHNFNNILTGVLGNITLARAWVNPEDRVFNRLTEAEKASLRAAELARQLLTFARGGSPVKKSSSIQSLLIKSVQFSLTGSNVRSSFSFTEGLWPVEVDEGQISQVIQNIVINAQQAMPKGGTIQVKAKNLTIGETDGEALSLRKGEYVKLSIRDDGIGIPEENLSKIFDPYFTTKQNRSGLGLSISYSIIHRHNGYITVESRPGAGATFTLYLPASSRDNVPQKKVEEEVIIMGRGRVLMMDDEESILDIAGEILRDLGYEVDLARGGTEAMRLYKNARDSGQPFDIVITDLTAHGDMSGVEVLQRLKEINPQVKVIVSSGYSNDPVIADFKTYGFSDVLLKPYRALELGQTLNRVLNS